MLGLIIFILAVAVIVVAVKVNTGGETGNVAGAGFDSTKTVNRNTNTGNPTVDYYRNKYKRMEQAGMKIDWWEFQKSVEKGWPYPVATEREREDICSFEHQALRGDAGSIIQLLFSYSHGSFEESNDSDLTIYKDEDKVHYWRNVLIQGAEQGNRNFQAAETVETTMTTKDGAAKDTAHTGASMSGAINSSAVADIMSPVAPAPAAGAI